MKRTYLYIILLSLVFTLISCNRDSDFSTNELGFSFKRCSKNENTPKVKQGDIIFGQMKILLNNKKEIFSNYSSPERLFIIGKGNAGSIDEFLMSLHLGDSAIMVAPADSLMQYTKNFETRPNDKVYIYLTISQIISSHEMTEYEKKQNIKRQNEDEALTEYVLNHYSRAEKKESGLFFLLTKEGNGKKAEYGKRIYVYYAVTDTLGKLYDTNIKQIAQNHSVEALNRVYKPFDFLLGDDSLIAGWSEGVSYMKEGDRATLIIPSYLAYGELGFGIIPADTPLIFDISVVKVENED